VVNKAIANRFPYIIWSFKNRYGHISTTSTVSGESYQREHLDGDLLVNGSN